LSKGIVLAGGAGTRLHPITKGVSKQLLPLYNKPMVYYPLSTLMIAGIKDILIISTPYDLPAFKHLLGDGSDFGVNFTYAEQPKPEGLAQAFHIAEDCGFSDGSEPLVLILGDNIFHVSGMQKVMKKAIKNAVIEDLFMGNYEDGTPSYRHINGKATVFGYYVTDPERYGVAEFDKDGNCLSIEEKPTVPKSNYAVPGLYIYPGDVIKKAREVKPSARGELEITTLNQMYLKEERLNVGILPRSSAWLDTGTFDSLSEASGYVETIEKRQGLKIACLEEIAYNNGWITKEQVYAAGKSMEKNEYGKYLLNLIK